MTSVQLSIVPPPLQYGPLSSNSNADSNLTYLNEKFVTIQEPPPKPRPQDQVRPDLPIPVPTDKPAGCYLILQRSRSVNKQSGPQTIRPLPERKGGSKFAFGCLPNKQPRAGPQYPAPSTTRRQDNIKPPAAKQPLRSKFGYYPIYERSPGLVESLKQQTTLTSKSTAKVPPPLYLLRILGVDILTTSFLDEFLTIKDQGHATTRYQLTMGLNVKSNYWLFVR